MIAIIIYINLEKKNITFYVLWFLYHQSILNISIRITIKYNKNYDEK